LLKGRLLKDVFIFVITIVFIKMKDTSVYSFKMHEDDKTSKLEELERVFYLNLNRLLIKMMVK
jgi:hypothetical protein